VAGFPQAFTISIFSPLWQGGAVLRTTHNYNSLSFEKRQNGGFWQAEIAISSDEDDIEDWIENGLGRHIQIYADELLWEGFVNSVDVEMGYMQYTTGPLMNIANRVKLIYSTVDTSVSPPAVGVRAETSWSEDADSKNRYGTLETMISSGGIRVSEASTVRDTYLALNKTPQQEIAFLSTGAGGITVRVNLLGYVHFLKRFTYTSTSTGTTTASQRIQDVLSADPNSIFSSDYAAIDTNSLSIPAHQNTEPGWDIIKAIIARGDSSNNQWIFGIEEGRKAYYNQLPSSIEYYFDNLSSGGFRDAGGATVEKYKIRPGRWMLITNFLPGRAIPAAWDDLQNDPRAVLVDAMRFTIPDSLEITLQQRASGISFYLARLGLSGIGG